MVSMTGAPDVQEVTPPDLVRLGGKIPLRAYLRSLWARREFATVVPIGDLKAQHMDTVLGNVWHLLNPLLLVGVYFLVFGVILGTRRGVDNFITFLAVGVFGFQYTQKAVLAGAKTIVSNQGLLRSIQFPRAILPVSAVVGQTVAFLPAASVMLLVALVTGERPTLLWLALVPVLALQALFCLGAAFVVARLTDMFRDFENVLPYFFRILFYLSGVLYSVEHYVSDPGLQRLFDVNPMYVFISLTRGPLLGLPMTGTMWLSALCWTTVLLAGGFAFFRAAEQRYGRA